MINMLYSNLKHCGFQCCVLGFIVSWTAYGFSLWLQDVQGTGSCNASENTYPIWMLFQVWLLLTVPLAFLCMGCCALYMVCGTLACCTNNSNTEDEERWKQENEALVANDKVN